MLLAAVSLQGEIMNRTTLIFIRHGETVANRENIFRGRMDFPLNSNGIEQARCLADALARFKIDVLYSSPLSRALDTAKPIATVQNIEINIEEKFTNISLGEWEGVPHSEIAEKFPAQYRLWLTEPERLEIPGGEKLSEVQRRSVEAVEEIVNKHLNCTVAIVSHRAVLKPLFAGLLTIAEPYFWKIHIDNAAYSIVYYSKLQGYTLYQSNCNQHLNDFVYEG